MDLIINNYAQIKVDFEQYKSCIDEIKLYFKDNEKYKSLYEIFMSLNNNDILLYFLLFKNNQKWINANFENEINISKIHKIEKIIKYLNSNNSTITKIFSIFIHWILYLHSELIKYFTTKLKINFFEINKIRYIIKQTLDIISYLFKNRIFNDLQMYDFLNLFFFFLDNNFLLQSFSDIIIKVKNYILFYEFFYLLEEFLIEINNKSYNNIKDENIINIINENKKISLSVLFNNLDEFRINKKVNAQNNLSMLINYDIIQNFMNNILINVNEQIMDKYEPKYTKILSNFYLKYIKANYKKSKIFDSIMIFLRQSFINLYNFEKNQNKIVHDFFINQFYLNILKKLFFPKKEDDINIKNNPNFDCFYFNGYDSNISLNVQNNTFEKSTLFFSFNLSPLQERKEYPLFLIQKDFDKKKDDILNIYLIKEENQEDFSFVVILDKIKIKLDYKIKANITYFISICFNSDQLLIKIYDPNNEIYSSPNITKSNKLLNINSITLSFGFYKRRVNVFSGYIGPIIILRNPKQLNDFITSVLKMKDKYKYYIDICKNWEFIEEDDLIFQNEEKYDINYKIDKVDCLLYIIPKNYRFFNEKSSIVNRLLFEDSICTIQDNYYINCFNVSIVKYENEIKEFIKDNGLDYICLLYEYIYQFSENYFNTNIYKERDFEKNKNLFIKYIFLIFKKTLFIIGKIYYIVKIENFTRNLKQIYMNLFSCLNILSEHCNIIDGLINYFFEIINYYHKYFSECKKLYLRFGNKFEQEFIEKNKYIYETNLSFMNGWIDFLLNPDIYDFENKDILITLFNNLSLYFNYLFANKESDKINKSLYTKLISFISKLYEYYGQNDKKNKDEINTDKNDNQKGKEENIIMINKDDDKNNIFKIFLNSLNSFFANNISEKEKINNFKGIFKIINEMMNINDKSFFIFYKFINKYISDNIDLYFHNDENDEQISVLIKNANKFILSKKNISKEMKENKNIISKLTHFDELISEITGLLMRILFSKEKLIVSNNIIKNFIIKNYEISDDLISTISKEIKYILSKYILRSNQLNKNINEIKKPTANKKYFEQKSEITKKYYNELFNIIKFILDYTNVDINNSNNAEEQIIEILEYINKILKIKVEYVTYNQNSVINNDMDKEYLDTIYCIINFLKFYHCLFFQKVYSLKFINNFMNLCHICFSSGLIYSNILIDTKENNDFKKSTLEIVLDICFFYIYLSTKYYLDKISISDKVKEEISKEQVKIYEFINNLFPIEEENNTKIKEKNKKYTIAFINDYLRYLTTTYPKEGKKRPKKDPIYQDNETHYNNIQVIYEYLSKEKKFDLNFTTYFLLKFNGYSKVLIDISARKLDAKIHESYSLKTDEILTLIPHIIQKNYEEQTFLYSKLKNFFFPKNANLSFYLYAEIKKKLEINFKKKHKNCKGISDYILTEIFKTEENDVFSLIYSGLCLIKKEENKDEPKLTNNKKHKFSFNFEERKSNENKFEPNSYTSNDENQNQLSFANSLEKSQNTNLNIKQLLNSEEEENDYELLISESNSSEKIKNNINDDNSANESTIPSSINNKNSSQNKNKKLSSKSINKDIDFDGNRKISSYSYNSENSIDSTTENNTTLFNFFFQPDKYLLKNSKKQLMLTVFSIHFFDYFFYNKSFKLLKNFFVNNIKGIQKATKLLNYPSKIKIFSNGLEPYFFLKPNSSFFMKKTFSITHEYFSEYIKKRNIEITEPIILYKKLLPKFNIEDKFDINCELIRMDRAYYGHMIVSKTLDYLIFEKLKYDFFEEINDYNKNKNSLDYQQKEPDIMKIFTLSYSNKKPINKCSKKILPIIDNNKRFKRNKVVIISFDEIEEIIERRFLLMWQAIEIYLKNGKSYFFNFLSKEKNNSILDIFKNNKKTKDKIHTKNFFKSISKYLINEWMEEQLTTYEYLLFMNKLSTRTYNDINQYPIYPWIIRKYEINQTTNEVIEKYRDFKYPMASQLEQNRDMALQKFQDDEENGDDFPIHHGTHYTTSSYIYFYLMREEPFTTLLIKLQGNKQENPDRMFYSFVDTLTILESGHDNRECIPDLVAKAEQYINLNCVDFGKKNSGVRVDDFNIYIYDEENDNDKNLLLNFNNFTIKDYAYFILCQKKLLNNIKISFEISEWFDIIFGVGQIPTKNIKHCLNIFNKETYEQKTNLYEELKRMKEDKSDLNEIIKIIGNKIDLMISFGQTPFQLFDEKHPKFEKEKKSKIKKDIDYDDDDDDDYEKNLVELFRPRHYNRPINIQPIYFEIYPSIGKIILIDLKRNIEIINTNFYDIERNDNKLGSFALFQLPHIKYLEQIKIKNKLYYIYKQKYCISAFPDKINLVNDSLNDSDDNSYSLYYNNYIQNLSSPKNTSKTKNNTKDEMIIITCRYIDNSFKIHYISNDKKNNQEGNLISVICEDFVCSCCTLNGNKFLVGLKNGKLIEYSLYNEVVKDSKNKKEIIKIKLDKKIQAHKKGINVIEVDFRLGIIITAGDDNYLFIRKIYDLELLTSIKIKSKFIITMAKISSLNFLYVQCFNKHINKSIIFGYTLNGLYFAKSKYEYFDSFYFTRKGNIVAFANKNEIKVFNGYDLKEKINKMEDKENKIFESLKKKVNISFWLAFNTVSRKNELEKNILKTITIVHTNTEKKKVFNYIEAVDISDLTIFD